MLELVSDSMGLWLSLVVTFLVVAAFTKALFIIEWELQATGKQRMKQVGFYPQIQPHLIHQNRVWFHPKIPAYSDHTSDDEDSSLVVVN